MIQTTEILAPGNHLLPHHRHHPQVMASHRRTRRSHLRIRTTILAQLGRQADKDTETTIFRNAGQPNSGGLETRRKCASKIQQRTLRAHHRRQPLRPRLRLVTPFPIMCRSSRGISCMRSDSVRSFTLGWGSLGVTMPFVTVHPELRCRCSMKA